MSTYVDCEVKLEKLKIDNLLITKLVRDSLVLGYLFGRKTTGLLKMNLVSFSGIL